MRQILLDTGPIVAFLDRKDLHHQWAVSQFKHMSFPALTCEAVLTEAVYILDRAGLAPATVFDLLLNEAVTIAFKMEDEAIALQALMDQYRDQPMDLADACLVQMAELYPDAQVCTLDSDFHIYRIHRNKTIPVLMP